MRQVHEQRARAGTGIVACYVLHPAMHQTPRHDFSYSMRWKIFSILAATVRVVIFDEVFKDGSIEIELLVKDVFETEVNELVDNSLAKLIALIGHILADVLKENDLLTTVGNYRKDVTVFFCNFQ